MIARQGTGYRMMTDLDILAVRFPCMRDGVPVAESLTLPGG